MSDPQPPLSGIKVIEFSHMVMGPAAGVILADLGADVVKLEPLSGDNTRRLTGSGAGYFPMYNRNKRSVCIDLKSERGNAIARKLIAEADVLIENFRPGAMDKLGYGYAALAEINPGLIYCSTKGFLEGPYAERTALDEVAQMMGGLAYMTGPPGRPLRAGASVIDVVGGMFGVIGVLSALETRRHSGKGRHITSALFESTAFLVGQHMAQYAVTGEPARPMPVRLSAWAVYDVFNTGDGQQVFVAVVSDTQWAKFCEFFQLSEFRDDPGLAKNTERVRQRERIIPRVRELFARLSKDELMAKLERCGLPYAPICKPEELFDDAHLNHSAGLLEVTAAPGVRARLPALPLQMDGERFGARRDVPEPGRHTREGLAQIGFSEEDIAALLRERIVAAPEG